MRAWSLPHPRTVAALLAVFLALIPGACNSGVDESDFHGTVLTNPDPAPQFTLANQFDRPVSLAGYAGRVVVLTFLYTHCPDVCPIVTTQLRAAQEELGPEAESVSFIAVSVDPERDTTLAAREYLERWGLVDRWDYLVGDRERLEQIWKDYFISPVVDPNDPVESGSPGPTPAPIGAIDTLGAQIMERYLVIHSAPVFLIDREGTRRVVFTPPLDPQQVADDVRLLLR